MIRTWSVALALTLVAALTLQTQASHFRYGTIYWEPHDDWTTNWRSTRAPEFKVKFHLSLMFRRNFLWGAYFNEQWATPSPTPQTASWKNPFINGLGDTAQVQATGEADSDCNAYMAKFNANGVTRAGQSIECFTDVNRDYTGYQLRFPSGFAFQFGSTDDNERNLVPTSAPKICKSYLHKGIEGSATKLTCPSAYPNTPENQVLVTQKEVPGQCISEFDGTAASWADGVKSAETNPIWEDGKTKLFPASSVCTPWYALFGFFTGDTVSITNGRQDRATLDTTVTDINFEDTMLGNTISVEGDHEHTYKLPNVNGRFEFTAFFTGGNRIAELNNNQDGRFRLETLVLFDPSRPGNRSPVGTQIPILPIPYGETNEYKPMDLVQFQIAAFDPDPYDQVRYFLGNVEEQGGLMTNVEWNTNNGGKPVMDVNNHFFADEYNYFYCGEKRLPASVCTALHAGKNGSIANDQFAQGTYAQVADAAKRMLAWNKEMNYPRQPPSLDHNGEGLELNARTGIVSWRVGRMAADNTVERRVHETGKIKPGFYNFVVMIEELHAEPANGGYSDRIDSNLQNRVSDEQVKTPPATPPLTYNNAGLLDGTTAYPDNMRVHPSAGISKRRVKVPIDFLVFLYPKFSSCGSATCRAMSSDSNAVQDGYLADTLKTFESKDGFYGDGFAGFDGVQFSTPTSRDKTLGDLEVGAELKANSQGFSKVFSGKCKICKGGGNQTGFLNTDLDKSDITIITYDNQFLLDGKNNAGVSIVPENGVCKPNHPPYFLTDRTVVKGPTPSLRYPPSQTAGVASNCKCRDEGTLNPATLEPCVSETYNLKSEFFCGQLSPADEDAEFRSGFYGGSRYTAIEYKDDLTWTESKMYDGSFMPGEFTCPQGEDCDMYIVAYDPDECSELMIGTTGLFDQMSFGKSEEFTDADIDFRNKASDGTPVFSDAEKLKIRQNTIKRKFTWHAGVGEGGSGRPPFAPANGEDDERKRKGQEDTFVCFFASDKYTVTALPFHCISLKLEQKTTIPPCEPMPAPYTTFEAYLDVEMCIPLCWKKEIESGSLTIQNNIEIDIRSIHHEIDGVHPHATSLDTQEFKDTIPYDRHTFQYPYDETNFPSTGYFKGATPGLNGREMKKEYCIKADRDTECVYTVCFQGYDKATMDLVNDPQEIKLDVSTVRCFKIEVVNAVIEFTGAEQLTDSGVSGLVLPEMGLTFGGYAYPRCGTSGVARNMTMMLFTSTRNESVTVGGPMVDTGNLVRNSINFHDDGMGSGYFFYSDDYVADAISDHKYACGKWHFVAVSIAESNAATLYVDSAAPSHQLITTRDEVQSSAVPFSTPSRPDHDVDGDVRGLMHVGAGIAMGTPWDGYLDELVVYNKGLSAIEVESVKLARLVGATYEAAAFEDGLVAYYTTKIAGAVALGTVTAAGLPSDSGDVTALKPNMTAPKLVHKSNPGVKPCVLGLQHIVGPSDGDCMTDVYGWNFAEGVHVKCSFDGRETEAVHRSEKMISCLTPGHVSPRFVTVTASNDGYNFTNTVAVDKTVRHLYMESALYVNGLGGGAKADGVCEDLAGRGFSMTAWVCPKCGPSAPQPPAPPTTLPPPPPATTTQPEAQNIGRRD